ncbi:MAG: AMP-binding protein, partial [Candidatus Eremiobacterota bacterium]
PLVSGATLYIIPASIRLSPPQLNEYYETNNITGTFLPTQLGEQFMALINNKSLKWLLIGGEKLRSFTPQRYALYNAYGPTEYTVITSLFSIDKYYENIPIGKPVYNTSVYITDRFENLQPAGVPGELCVSGRGLSRGYLNKKELTEEKFVVNPFRAGEKMYKTGDLARWLPDGNLEFLGRIDRQVKIRGFRIELAEIEQSMKSFDFIKEALVVDHTDENNRPYLCGYYMADEEIDIDKLKRDLAKNLPDYMIPRHILKIDKIPITPNGKVDKKALPLPDKSSLTAGYVAPETEEERFMAKIWEDILKCGSVGIHDDFFSLGGDSITSIQVVARAREAGINISAAQLQSHPSISQLLSIQGDLSSKKSFIEEKEEAVPDRSALLPEDIDPSSVEAVYGLSPLQEGLLFHAMASPDSDLYCTQMCWTYEGDLHTDALKEAWNEILSAHPPFRTGFVWHESDKPLQIVYRDVPLPWHTVDLSGTERDIQEKEIEHIRINERLHGFNLNKPPLSSFYLINTGKCEYRFIWTHHHIILDGWSLPLILKELYGRYEAILHKETFHCKKAKPFEAYIKWLSAQDEDHIIDYWKNTLSDFSVPTPLTINHSRLDIHKPIEDMKERIHNISEEFMAECQGFARSKRVTTNALFQLAWSAVLSCYSGSDDILFGSTVSGRPPELDGVENMTGLFINTIPFRVKLTSSEPVMYNLKHIQNAIQECNNFSHISLNKLQPLSDIPPGETLFYSLYVFENFPFHEDYYENPAVSVKDLKAYQKTTYPLNLIIVPGKGLTIQVLYDGDCFSEQAIELMIYHIESALKWIVRNSEDFLKNMDIVTEHEKNLILKTFNDTYVEVPQETVIQELIEKQVELNSEKIAVVYKNEKLSYRELNEKANKLAHMLRQEGVTRDSRVAILLDRSCHMIVSVLAVLKAGGCYVPIDPEYPVERIKYIISDSGALMLITEPHLAEKINPSIPVLYATDYDDLTSRDASRVTRHDSHKNPEHINTSKDLAYIIYTSGSTGQPKGVMIEHRSLVNMCFWYKHTRQLSEKDSMTKYASFGFDASVWEIFPCLISGASLHVIGEDIRLSPSELNTYYEENNITVSFLPTQFTEQFIEMFENKSLRWLDTGGDKLRSFKKKNYDVVNNYGPTEYTVCTTSFVIDKYYENIPIGKPVYNTIVYILD